MPTFKTGSTYYLNHILFQTKCLFYRFLRGTCGVTDCPFSHQVAPEKMAVCTRYLRGVCSRDECPYRHVNVGLHAQPCQDFLKGYCPRGNKVPSLCYCEPRCSHVLMGSNISLNFQKMVDLLDSTCYRKVIFALGILLQMLRETRIA